MKYIEAKLEIVAFEERDIITTSTEPLPMPTEEDELPPVVVG